MNSYFQCATILTKMGTEQKSLKTLIYDEKNQGNKAEQLVIVQGILQNSDTIDRIVGFMKKVDPEGNVKNESLLKILVYEMFFGRQKLKIGGQIAKYVKRNKDKVLEKFKREIVPREQEKTVLRKKVHFRVLPGLPMDKLVLIDKGAKRNEIIPSAYEFEESDYKVFNKEKFPLYQQEGIVVQSKSSCLPVYALKAHLKLPKGSIVESCSSPGNKTLQILEYFPTNKLHSFELDPQRFETLSQRIEKHSKALQSGKPSLYNQSFFESLNLKNLDHSEVIAAVIDPSCSGSGMIQNNYQQESEQKGTFKEYCEQKYQKLNDKDKQKVLSLRENQINFLQYTVDNFPNLKAMVYSTCSLYKKENEEVVQEILKGNPNWQLVNLFPEGQFLRGFPLKNCESMNLGYTIRCSSMEREEDGFFVAVFAPKEN